MTTLPFDRRVNELTTDAAPADAGRRWRERAARVGCIAAVLALLPQLPLLLGLWTWAATDGAPNAILTWWHTDVAPVADGLGLAAAALAGLGLLSGSPPWRGLGVALVIVGCVLAGLLFLSVNG